MKIRSKLTMPLLAVALLSIHLAGEARGAPPPAPAEAPCDHAIDALAAKIYEAPRACTAVVRLGYETRAILGYQLVCGKYGRVDEAEARRRAQEVTDHGATARALGPANPEDMYVFYERLGDFGGVAAVAVPTGLPVFGGSIDWRSRGDISYPRSWRSAEELGAGCPAVGDRKPARGYDLRDGKPLPEADVSSALAVIEQTALPGAFWKGGYVFGSVVLLYPRTIGAFIPANAEWIVLLNGGWLE